MIVESVILRLSFDLLVLALACVLCFFLVWQHRKNLFLMLAVPVIVLAALDAYYSVDAVLGTSRISTLPEGQVNVLGTFEGKDHVHIWYLDDEIGSPRAVRVPSTPENKKKARGLDAKLRNGKNAIAGFKRGLNNMVELEEYDFNVEFHGKKGGQIM